MLLFGLDFRMLSANQHIETVFVQKFRKTLQRDRPPIHPPLSHSLPVTTELAQLPHQCWILSLKHCLQHLMVLRFLFPWSKKSPPSDLKNTETKSWRNSDTLKWANELLLLGYHRSIGAEDAVKTAPSPLSSGPSSPDKDHVLWFLKSI